MRRDGKTIWLGVLVSLLLHGLLVGLLRGTTGKQRLPAPALQVRLQLTVPPLAATQPPAGQDQPPKPRTGSPARQRSLPAMIPPLPAPPATAKLPVDVPPPGLAERALASVRDVDRSLREEAEQRKQLLPAKPLPANLAALPPPLQTAIARRFEQALGELVVLEVREQQEGSNRVTFIRTSKGNYCYYQPIQKKPYLRDMPVAAQGGTCSPQ